MKRLFSFVAIIGFSTFSLAQDKKPQAEQLRPTEGNAVNTDVNSVKLTRTDAVETHKKPVNKKNVTAKKTEQPMDYVALRNEEERKTGMKQMSRSSAD